MKNYTKWTKESVMKYCEDNFLVADGIDEQLAEFLDGKEAYLNVITTNPDSKPVEGELIINMKLTED